MNHDPTTGKWTPGNTAALTHGGRRRSRSLVEVRQSELYARWLQDLGGPDKVSAAQEATLVRAVEADMIATSAMQYLAQISQRESLTSRRAQLALATFQSATALLFRGVSILGLERVERAALDIHGYAAQKATEAQS